MMTSIDGEPEWRCPACGGARWFEGGQYAGRLIASVHVPDCEYQEAERDL